MYPRTTIGRPHMKRQLPIAWKRGAFCERKLAEAAARQQRLARRPAREQRLCMDEVHVRPPHSTESAVSIALCCLYLILRADTGNRRVYYKVIGLSARGAKLCTASKVTKLPSKTALSEGVLPLVRFSSAQCFRHRHVLVQFVLHGQLCVVWEYVPQLDLGSNTLVRTIGEGWGTSYFPYRK